jgi:mannose-6-phosphate isomerase-like protein (cupin superfamily)
MSGATRYITKGDALKDIPWLRDGYLNWVAEEGVPVIEDVAVHLPSVTTGPWQRMGVDGAFVHTHSRGDLCSIYVLDLPPGGATNEIHHLYEAVHFVLDGQGSVVVVDGSGRRRSFEFGRASLFCLPINARYRIFNASGRQRARVVALTNLPMVMKQFRNERFVFDSEYDFVERWGADQFFAGEGTLIPTWEQRHMWETNLVPDLVTFDELISSPNRGTGSANIQFVLGETTMHAHVSEVGVGQYKKAHKHRDGVHIVQLGSEGYSLYWFEGEEPRAVRWDYGMLHSPATDEWHQHFNVSDRPGRYLAMSYGGYRYPFTAADRANILHKYSVKSSKQIEYEDEDPQIRQRFDDERTRFAAGGVRT